MKTTKKPKEGNLPSKKPEQSLTREEIAAIASEAARSEVAKHTPSISSPDPSPETLALIAATLFRGVGLERPVDAKNLDPDRGVDPERQVDAKHLDPEFWKAPVSAAFCLHFAAKRRLLQEAKHREIYPPRPQGKSPFPQPAGFPAFFPEFLKKVVKAHSLTEGRKRYHEFLRFTFKGRVPQNDIEAYSVEQLAKDEGLVFGGPDRWDERAKSYLDWWAGQKTNKARESARSAKKKSFKKPIDRP